MLSSLSVVINWSIITTQEGISVLLVFKAVSKHWKVQKWRDLGLSHLLSLSEGQI